MTSATETVTLTYGAATKLAITTQPVGGNAAGSNLTTQPVVEIQDADSNTVTNSMTTVSLGVNSDASGNVAEGTTSTTALAGVATFSGVKFVGTPGANYKLSFTSAGLTSALSNNISVTHAAADHLVVSNASGIRAGIAFTTQPVVTMKDRYGYTVTSGAASTANVVASSDAGTLGGAKTVALASGVATFTNLKLDGTIGGYKLTFATASPAFSVDQNVTLTFGVRDHLTVTRQPVGGNKVGDALTTQPWVEVRDLDGNLVTDNTDTVAVAVLNDTAGSVAEGSTTATAVSGVAKFTGVILSGDSTRSYKLNFTSGALTAAASNSMTFINADADSLDITAAAAGLRAGVDFATQPEVTIRDRYSNVVTTGASANANITVASNKGTLTGTKTVAAVNGVATFTNLNLAGVIGTDYALTFTLATPTLSTTQSAITLAFGNADHLTITTAPAGGNMTGDDLSTQPVVEVRDLSDNVVADSNDTVSVAVDGDTTGSLSSGTTSVSASSGVATFTGVSLVGTPGTSYAVKFAAGGMTSATAAGISVVHADVSQIAFVTQPAGGNRTAEPLTTQPVVEMRDRFGNRVTRDSTSTITVSIASGSNGDLSTGETTVTVDQGRATFNSVTLIGTALANYQFSFALDGTQIESAASNSIHVVHNVASYMTLQGAANAKAGIAFSSQPTVTIKDDFGNTVIDGDGSTALITASVDHDSLVGTVSIHAVAGVATFSNLGIAGKIGQHTITFDIATPALDAVSQNINLSYGTAAALAITTQPGGGNHTADNLAVQPVVHVVDAYGNTVANSTATVTASLLSDTTSASLTGTTKASVAGVATFTALNLLGTPAHDYTFRFTSGSLAAVNATALRVNPALASNFTFARQPVGGNATHTALTVQPALQIRDRFGNIVTTDNSSVLTAHISGAGGALEGTATATASSGIVSFSGLKVAGTPGVDYSLTFTSTITGADITSASSSNFRVIHGPADHIDVTVAADGAKAGLAFKTQPTVTIRDADGFAVISGANSTSVVTATVSRGGVAVGTATATAVAGVATFENLGVGGVIGDYTLTYSIATPAISVDQPISVDFGTATQVAMITQPVGAITGDEFATQPAVEIQDAYGNKVADYNSTADIAIDSGDGGTLTENTSTDVVNGEAQFVGTKFQGTPGADYRFVISVDLLTTATTDIVNVVHGPAASIQIVTQPRASVTGELLTRQPVVRLLDRLGYLVTSDSSTVVSIQVSSGSGGSFSGATTAAVVNGVATFAGVKFTGEPYSAYKAAFTATPNSALLTSDPTTAFSVAHAVASQLAITTQPVSGVTGTVLSTQPVIEVRDRFGNLVDDDLTTQVTVAISQGDGGVLAGTKTVTAIGGVVTFTNLKFTALPGTDYKLTFSSGALAADTSSVITVTHAAAAKLAIQAQPVGAATGDNLASQPVVRVLDQFGNLVTSDNRTVVSVSVGLGSAGSLGGTLTATAVAGIATFEDVSFVATPLANYRLDFTADGLTSVRSAAVVVTHNTPIKLTFKTQPAGGATGSNLPTQPVLELRDLYDNIATSDSSTVVSATVTTGNDSVLTGETATARAGIVNFNALNLVGNPGETYRITFSVGDMTITSQDVVVTHAVPAKLRVRTQPVGALTGDLLATAPLIEVLDRFGNLATSDNSTTISAAIDSGIGGNITAGSTATAKNGVVTFSGLKLTGKPGEPYALKFTSGSLTSATAETITVRKYADVTFSYQATRYVPNGIVSASFVTDSPSAPSFSTSSSAQICVVDSATGDITIKGVGTCTVAVNVPEATYYLSPVVTPTATLIISKAVQSAVSVTSATTMNYQSTMVATAIGGSGTGAMTFSVTGECQLVGTTIVPNDAGTLCKLTATRLGDANYLAQSSDVQTIMINMIEQAPVAIANAPTSSWGSLALLTTGGSGTGAVSYQVVDSGTANCSVSAATLISTNAGQCVVRATKALSTNFYARSSAPFTFTFSKLDQSISFTSNVPNFPVAKSIYTLAATASSALPVDYSIADGAGTVCKISGAKVTFLASGDCLVEASSDGDLRYNATLSTQLIKVGMLNQQITFADLADRKFGTPAFLASATSNAGLNIAFTLGDNTDSGACSVTSAGVVKLLAAGRCEIVASQSGNATYAPASPVVQSFMILADVAGSPYIYAVASGVGQVTATFSAPSYTGGSPVTGYQLVATDTDGNVYSTSNCAIDSAPLSCSIDGLSSGLAYTMKVAAITEAGLGRFSPVAQAMTPGNNPVAVNNLTAQPADAGVLVSWTPPVALDGDFVSYEVYLAPRGEAFSDTPNSVVSDASATSTTIAGFTTTRYSRTFGRAIYFRGAAVANGYDIKVVTVTSVSRGDSNSSKAVLLGKSIAGAPTSVVASGIGTSLVVSWSAPTVDGGSPIVGYRVSVNGNDICTTTEVGTCTLKNIAYSTTFNVSVLAINGQGDGIPAVATYKTKAAPKPAPEPQPTPTDEPTPTPTPTVEPTPTPTPTDEPSPTPTPTATEQPIIPIVIPTITPGEPIANPAIGATGDDNAPPTAFNAMSTPEGIRAVTATVTKVTAVVGAVAAAAGAAAAAAGAAAGSAGAAGAAGAGAGAGASAGGGASGGSAGGSKGDSGSSSGSIANIDAEHHEFTLRRRGRGDRWRIWKSRFFTALDKLTINLTFAFAKFSPILSKTVVDGAYLRSAAGILGALPSLATITLAVISISPSSGYILPPVWPVFLAIVLIGVFDAFAGLLGTAVFVVGSILVHVIGGQSIALGDIRLLLGVVIAGFGPVLLANQFRQFRRDPQRDGGYRWERLVDMAVLPFFGGWTAASMIATLPALAGLTLAAANHVNDFALAVAVAMVIRVFLEEAVARVFPMRLDTLHPTEVPSTYRGHKYVALFLRVSVFIFVTAALLGNSWLVWLGSILFAVPTVLGWFKDKFPNFPWLWRILPHGIPGLALVLIVSQLTSNLVGSWFGSAPDLALWSFALLPIPLLALSVLGILGREGLEGEVRLIKRPSLRWVYRIGGIIMLIVTMKLAGVI